LSIPIPKNIYKEDNDNNTVVEEDDEDTIQCIHYPTMDGTLPASTINVDTPLSLSSLFSASPAPLMPIADAGNNGVVETRYPLSLSIPLPINAENEKDDAIPYPTVNGWTVDPSKFCAGLLR